MIANIAGCQVLISSVDSGLVRHAWLSGGYVRTKQGYLHQLIAKRIFQELPSGYFPDHIDTNRLNNLRSNFRLATSRGQMLNTTRKLKGYERHGRVWRLYDWDGEKKVNLKTFVSESEALTAAIELRIQKNAAAHLQGHYIYPGGK